MQSFIFKGKFCNMFYLRIDTASELIQPILLGQICFYKDKNLTLFIVKILTFQKKLPANSSTCPMRSSRCLFCSLICDKSFTNSSCTSIFSLRSCNSSNDILTRSGNVMVFCTKLGWGMCGGGEKLLMLENEEWKFMGLVRFSLSKIKFCSRYV